MLLVWLVPGGASAAPPARLTAEQILAKNAAARGGLEAWRKVNTMVWLGHIQSTHAQSPSMLFMLAQKRPNKTRFEINAMSDKSLRVFNGKEGWKLRPTRGRADVQPYSSEEVRFAQNGPGLDGPLIDCVAKGSSVSLVGVDEIDKHRAYHLSLLTAAGERQQVWVDADTFLEMRYDRAVEAPMEARGAGSPGAQGAQRTVSVIYRDFKANDGLMIPSIIETGAGGGATPDRMAIERVVINPPLDDKAFNDPTTERSHSPARIPPRGRAAQSRPPAWLADPSAPAPPPSSPPSPADAPAQKPQ